MNAVGPWAGLLLLIATASIAGEPGSGRLSEREAWVLAAPDSIVATLPADPRVSVRLTAGQMLAFLGAFDRPHAHGLFLAAAADSAEPVVTFVASRDAEGVALHVAPQSGSVWRGSGAFSNRDRLGMRRLVVALFPELTDRVGPLSTRTADPEVALTTIDAAHRYFGLHPGPEATDALPVTPTNSGEVQLAVMDAAGVRLSATASWQGLFLAVGSESPHRVAAGSREERALWLVAYTQLLRLSGEGDRVPEGEPVCGRHLPGYPSMLDADGAGQVVRFLAFIERGQRTVRQYLCDE